MSKTKNSNRRTLFLLLLPLIAIISVSGCTNQSPTGAGVVITEFTSDFTNIYSSEEVTLQLQVKNNGPATATNVRAELSGINEADWGIIQSVFDIGDLQAYDPETQTPGGEQSVYWDRLTTPILAKGVQIPFTPTVRVSYDYRNTATKPITIVDQDELRRIIQRGGTLPSEATTQTGGPVSIDITTGNHVKTTSTGLGQTYDIFPINIHIENTQLASGGNVVPLLLAGGPERNPVHITITPPSGTNFVYTGYRNSNDCSQFLIAELFRGKDIDITCELEVITPPSISDVRYITVDIKYRYTTDSSTTITVTGTNEPSII